MGIAPLAEQKPAVDGKHVVESAWTRIVKGGLRSEETATLIQAVYSKDPSLSVPGDEQQTVRHRNDRNVLEIGTSDSVGSNHSAETVIEEEP